METPKHKAMSGGPFEAKDTTSFANRLQGRLLLPSDNGYDEARIVWNATVDRRTPLVVFTSTS